MRTIPLCLLAVIMCAGSASAQEKKPAERPPDLSLTAVGRQHPVRESLGATLLAAGQAQEAEQVFREDLVRNPRNPRSLFGLMQCLKAQQEEADAVWIERQF